MQSTVILTNLTIALEVHSVAQGTTRNKSRLAADNHRAGFVRTAET